MKGADEFPPDIESAALSAFAASFRYGSRAVATAIVAERQRCADATRAEFEGFKDRGLSSEAYGALIAHRAILGATT